MKVALRMATNGSTASCPMHLTTGKPGLHGRGLLYLDPGNAHSHISELLAANWHVDSVTSLADIKSLNGCCRAQVGVVCLDSNTDGNGSDSLATTLSAKPDLTWIALLSDHPASNPSVADLINRYCLDFFTFPFDMEHLQMALGHACGMAQLQPLNVEKTDTVRPSAGLVGNSEAMQQVYRRIRKIAAVNAPVMLIGESGTGKELAAQAIHHLSARSDKAFIAVNCAALPAELIQSELFGHEKGAFTGAHDRHIGRFEAANGGTLFLDEISDLPLELQINLLRFLEEREIERVGSHNSIAVDARVIAASHQDLAVAVKEGRFREDLYYRLNVLQLQLPRLCDRRDDIAVLAEHAFHRFFSESQPRARGFSNAALRAMEQYHWPGNVRELNNLVCRAMVMAERRSITPADLGLEDYCLQSPQTKGLTLEESRMQAAKKAIEAGLRRTRNNVSQTARELRVSRTTLYRLMDELGCSP